MLMIAMVRRPLRGGAIAAGTNVVTLRVHRAED
jgi:hypothetical protein